MHSSSLIPVCNLNGICILRFFPLKNLQVMHHIVDKFSDEPYCRCWVICCVCPSQQKWSIFINNLKMLGFDILIPHNFFLIVFEIINGFTEFIYSFGDRFIDRESIVSNQKAVFVVEFIISWLRLAHRLQFSGINQ